VSDWLDIEETPKPPASLPAVVEPVTLPVPYAERVSLAADCWARLNDRQRKFLAALREYRFNVSKTAREIGIHRSQHIDWMHVRDYATVVRVWRSFAGEEAIDRDRLLARQDDIVETLLTPQPILHQGAPTGFHEVQGSAAARANETLMKAAGMLKDKDVEVNVGIVGPALQIQVMQPNGEVKDVTPRGVPVELPEPVDAEWTEL
jgi:hypothetical protein